MVIAIEHAFLAEQCEVLEASRKYHPQLVFNLDEGSYSIYSDGVTLGIDRFHPVINDRRRLLYWPRNSYKSANPTR